MDDLSKAMQEATAYLDRQKDDKKRVEPNKTEIQSPPRTTMSAVKSKTREVQSNPTLVLAYGAAIALAIFAAGISTQWLVPALGAGFGIATNIISKGIFGGNTDYSWVIPTGSGGLVLIGGVGVVFLLIKIVKQAKKQLYLAVLPLLAVLAGFCVDMCKGFYPDYPLVRIGFGAVTSAIFVMGGLWWKRYGLLNKIAGTLMILLSPLVILAHGVSTSIDQGLGIALSTVTTQSWIAILTLFAILISIGLLAFTLGEEINP
jgi:hypothetical protein